MRTISAAYLASYVMSLLGNSIAAVALPLIVLQTTGSILGAGTVAAATAIPALLAGIVMGVVIDRINRRTSSVVTDLISAAAIAALPLVDLLVGLEIGWFILFGIIGSIGDVPGMTARETLLPSVVAHGALSAERLVGLREGLGAVAFLTGPAIAGILVSVTDGSSVLWITAATSLTAALITLAIPHRVGRITADPTAAGAARASGWQQLREGWRALAQSRLLVAVTVISVISATVLSAFQGIVLPVWATLLDQPALLGFVLSALAAGLLIGGGVYVAVGRRGTRRMWLLIGIAGSTVGMVLIAWLPSSGLVLLGAVVLGAASGLLNSVVGVLLIDHIADRVRGRVLSTQNAIMTIAAPAGILIAALLIETAGLTTGAWVIASLWLVVIAVTVLARSLRHLDAPPTEGGVAAHAQ